MKPQEALTRIIENREIFHEEMLSLMRQIMSGEVSPVMIAAIVTGLRVKKETIGEISAAAMVMREINVGYQGEPVAQAFQLADHFLRARNQLGAQGGFRVVLDFRRLIDQRVAAIEAYREYTPGHVALLSNQSPTTS